MKAASVPALLVLAALVVPASRSRVEAGQKANASTSAAPSASAATPVDSAIPIDEALRRFRADIPSEPSELDGGFTSREALVRGFVRALEQSDTLALERLVLNRAEFAYLYYPSSPLSAPPYALPPSLMWFQLQSNNRKAAEALLRRRSGASLGYVRHECATHERQGGNIVWSDCLTVRRVSGGGERGERLFGTVLERDGRYKLVGLSNELR